MVDDQAVTPVVVSFGHRDQPTFRADAHPFLNVLPVVGKTVSNIPASMVTGIDRHKAASLIGLSLPAGSLGRNTA